MSTDTLRITLVQSDLRWEAPEVNCDALAQQLTGIDAHVTDLILLPEMFATGFTMNSRAMAEPYHHSRVVEWMRIQARQRNCVVCGSVAIVEQGQYYNRLVWATPDGELTHYDKRHLFRMAGEHERYGMGERRVVVQLKGVRILLSVCYDLRFPVWLRQQSTPTQPFEYDLMLCVANWPAPRRHPWRTLLQARAIENLCYVAAVNRVGEDAKGNRYSGDSMLVDFKGEALCDPEPWQPCVVTSTLDLAALEAFRQQFPAWQDADPFHLD